MRGLEGVLGRLPDLLAGGSHGVQKAGRAPEAALGTSIGEDAGSAGEAAPGEGGVGSHA